MATEITGSTGITTPNIVSPLQTISTRLDLTGGQIKFPATQVPSSDANILDDYEEGTFTPTVSGSTTAGVGTYVERNGYYTKIGNKVLITIYIAWAAHTGTGTIYLKGLPFVVASTYFAPSFRTDLITIPAGSSVQAFLSLGTSEIRVETYVSASVSGLNLGSPGSLICSAQYSTT